VRLIPADPAQPDVGELHLRNPGLAAGYRGQDELWAERTRDGWFRTGDLMRRDADGYYYFLGRTDDMINVAGEKVYPKEVERLVALDEAIAAVVVVPMSHPLKGQVPAAFVVPRPGAVLDTERIRQRFFSGGPAYAYPRLIFPLDAFPLNGAGKPDRRRLTAIAAESAQAAVLSS
jgi:long-chain acyl-CoA synthetase